MRKQLKDFSTIDDFLNAFQKAKKIVFITGAGVSVSCGIPDFRSATGIYNTMECQEIGIPSPELLFDLEFFLMDPSPFFKYAHNLIPDGCQPSATHRFISFLESKKKLLRNYTQNIDGLERASGQKKVVECHGTMDTFQCVDCRKKLPLSELRDTVVKGVVPHCQRCDGIMKPMITFFGERTPSGVNKFAEDDMKKCDLVVVMGTSLKVGGAVIELLRRARNEVPQVLINLNPVDPPSVLSSEGFDITLLGKCDDIVTFISDMMRINEDKLKMKSLGPRSRRKKLCVYCRGTGKIRQSSSDILSEKKSTEVIMTPSESVRRGSRNRRPSSKLVDYSTGKKRKLESIMDGAPYDMSECPHCKQSTGELKALEEKCALYTDLHCKMLDNPRQYAITAKDDV